MAVLRLFDYELQAATLPAMCMKCGAPAAVEKNRTFSWHPSWIFGFLALGPFPFILLAFLLAKRKRLAVPLCGSHRNLWLNRQLGILASLVVTLALGTWAVLAAVTAGRRGDVDAFGLAWIACLTLLVAWLILAALLTATAIRPHEITDRSITLIGVSKEFVLAFDDSLDYARRADEATRGHWRGATRAAAGPTDHIRPREEGRPDSGAYRE